MSENGRSRRNGGFDEDSAQIHEHQKKQDEETQLEKIWKEIENSDEGIEIDPDKFLRDMAILDDLIPLPDFDLSASWQDFKEKHHDLLAGLDPADQQSSDFALEEESPKRKRPMKPARVALVVVLILAMLAMASCGVIEYILKAVANWSDQVFQYEVTQELREKKSAPDIPDTQCYSSLEDALKEYGVTTEYVGIQFLTDAILQTVRIREYSGSIKFAAVYMDNEKEINFTIWHYHDSASLELNAAEKMPSDAERYICGETTFYLIKNTENTTITWVEGTEKYTLWGDFSERQAKQMIDSIHKGPS